MRIKQTYGSMAKYNGYAGKITWINGDVHYLFSSNNPIECLLGLRVQEVIVAYPDEWQPSEELLKLVSRRIRPKQESN